MEPGGRAAGLVGQSRSPADDDEEEASGSETGDDESEDDDETLAIEGAYNPDDYKSVTESHPELAELFDFIRRYTPQHIELDHRLRPFVPDFIPAVGDIDAFVKPARPDAKEDRLGLSVLDEPTAQQSDPTVLDLQLRAVGKLLVSKQTQVAKLQNAERNPKAVDKWIASIGELHRHTQAPSVQYVRPMPDIEQLMREWPPEMEEMLKQVALPQHDIDCDLPTFADVACSLLDIPVYKNRIQSLHVLFTLYSAFASSQHFRQLAEANELDNRLKDKGGADADYEGFN